MARSELEQVRYMRKAKRKALSLADRAQVAADRARARGARKAQNRETRARVRRALATLRKLAKVARARLVARQKEERRRLLAELRARALLERETLRVRYAERRAAIRTIGLSQVERRRQLDRAAREHAAALREARKREEKAKAELAKVRARAARERQQESDQAVELEIETHHPEWLGLWRRVKGRIKARAGMSRAEAFFHYAHENTRDAYAALDDGQDEWIREQEAALYREHGYAAPRATRRRAA